MASAGWRPPGLPALGLVLLAAAFNTASCKRLPAAAESQGTVRANGLTPLHHVLSLVAGSGFAGHEDGSFVEARFRAPSGLAQSPDGRLLAVTDRGDHRVRLVRLSERNRVETLAGTGASGARDGTFDQATFDRPGLVVFLSPERLLVHEAGTGRLRILNIETRSVTTLSKDQRPVEVPGAFAMTATPGGRTVVLTQPKTGTVLELEVTTGSARSLISRDERITNPGPLTIHKGEIHVADLASGAVFRIHASPARPSVLLEAGSVEGLVALASSGDLLYGLRTGSETPLYCVDRKAPVPLVSVWDSEVSSSLAKPGPFLPVKKDEPVALVADARSERSFLFTTPSLLRILAVRDLDQGARRNALREWPGEPDDWNYPKAKAAGVFRILLVGDSHLFYGTDAEISSGGNEFSRSLTLAKRMELFLNTQAALEGRSRAYEVLQKVHGSWAPLGIWPAYEVPATAREWDIDLVLLLMPPSSNTLVAWFNFPMTEKGIPAASMDPEHLLLPAEEKLRKNPAERLFRLCRNLGRAGENGSQLEIGLSLGEMANVPEMRGEALELFGRPIGVLSRELAPRRLLLAYYPLGSRPEDTTGSEGGFFRELCQKRGIEFLDLTSPVTLLRETYHPISELSGFDHFNSGGHAVMGYLLAHELTFRKLVPF